MSQGQVIKGKTASDSTVSIRVDDEGRLVLDPTSVGGASGKPTDGYSYSAKSLSGSYKYFFFEDKDNNWYIMRKNTSTEVVDYAKGTGGVSSVFVDKDSAPSGSPTFASYAATF